MKKIIAFTVLTLCSASVLASGGFTGHDKQTNSFHAYTDNVGIAKVKDLSTYKAHARVSLRGTLSKHNGGMHYVFKDDTGEVNVSIKPAVWKSKSLKPGDMVEIEGFLDKHRKPMNIIVDEIAEIRK